MSGLFWRALASIPGPSAASDSDSRRGTLESFCICSAEPSRHACLLKEGERLRR